MVIACDTLFLDSLVVHLGCRTALQSLHPNRGDTHRLHNRSDFTFRGGLCNFHMRHPQGAADFPNRVWCRERCCRRRSVHRPAREGTCCRGPWRWPAQEGRLHRLRRGRHSGAQDGRSCATRRRARLHPCRERSGRRWSSQPGEARLGTQWGTGRTAACRLRTDHVYQLVTTRSRATDSKSRAVCSATPCQLYFS